jgi:hypothetical protein
MIKLFTIGSEEKSAKKLEFETFCYIYNYTEDFDNSVVIRWGNSQRIRSRNGNVTEFKNILNKAKSICTNCIKNKSLGILSNVVLTPTIYNAGDLVPKGIKVVYRYNEHTGGKDFRIMTGPFKVEYGFYGKEFINTKKEWRIFFVGEETMGSVRWKHKNDLDNVCRSLWSYEFKKIPEKLKQQTLLAKKALDLDFGCFDILEKDENYYFLEANTATTIDSRYILKFYQTGLNKLIKEKFPHLVK